MARTTEEFNGIAYHHGPSLCKEYIRLTKENEKLQEEKIRLEADISFWKPLACGLLSILFGTLGAIAGAFIMNVVFYKPKDK